MLDTRLLHIYRRMMATPADQDICWWYLGTTFVKLEGYPDIAALQAETIMIYRTETLSPHRFRIHWREIGYFRDPVSGEVATSWFNPVTGKTVSAPKSFEEGPSFYTIGLDETGLVIDLQQAHATVRSIGMTLHETEPGRLMLVQTEQKIRGFPLPDGTMPTSESGGLSETTTTLSMFADCPSAEATSAEPVDCSGTYAFELSILPPWMGFGDRPGRTLVQGIMRKTGLQEQLNSTAWRRLKVEFPGYFDGDVLAPPW